jgi:threonine synthase
MNLLAGSRRDFEKAIDPEYETETSIVLRYRNAFRFGLTPEEDSKYKKWLEKTSIREGARIFPLLAYQGVEIFILDETSFMHTKTLKSIDGCITIAKCKLNGYERVVFESGGNTGTALTQYGIREGLETFMFVPGENLSLLNSRIFESDKAHLFSVEKPDLVKKAAHYFVTQNGLTHIPERDWRYEASMFRGSFILERLLKKDDFDWLTQTVSAAFGPIGIYRVLKGFEKEIGQLPRFLGIQQESNSPLFTGWKKGEKDTEPGETNSTNELLTKVMYDSHPQTYGTFEEFRNILSATGGDLTTVNRQEFTRFLEKTYAGKNILDLLKEQGIDITVRGGEVIEKTGLISLAGTLKEIERGRIAEGSKVLCCLTSGVSEADGKAKPELRISTLDDLTEILNKIPWPNYVREG